MGHISSNFRACSLCTLGICWSGGTTGRCAVYVLFADPADPASCRTCSAHACAPHRAHVDSASELVKLYANKFDLLHSGSSAAPKKPTSGASAATIKALEELKTVINGHLKVCRVAGLRRVQRQSGPFSPCSALWLSQPLSMVFAVNIFLVARAEALPATVLYGQRPESAAAPRAGSQPLAPAAPPSWSAMQEASALEQNVKGKAVSAEAKRAQAVASIRREEGVLAQQASELAGQVGGCVGAYAPGLFAGWTCV